MDYINNNNMSYTLLPTKIGDLKRDDIILIGAKKYRMIYKSSWDKPDNLVFAHFLEDNIGESIKKHYNKDTIFLKLIKPDGMTFCPYLDKNIEEYNYEKKIINKELQSYEYISILNQHNDSFSQNKINELKNRIAEIDAEMLEL